MPNVTLLQRDTLSDNLCEQFDPDQDRSKLFDTLMVFLKDFFKKLILKKKIKNKQMTKRHEKLPYWQIVQMTTDLLRTT